MNQLARPLPAGQPITLWRHSAIAEMPFDVPERPMQGDMDPFFFLTKEKNFIPHEYPCRTDFAERFRNQRPQEWDAAAPDAVWLGFGSPRLDLSGFWFRPTRIAARAQAWIRAQTAGPARFRLATCGGAFLRLNAEAVGWMAEYRRNFETAVEIEVQLRSGENLVEVFFDDLAERDTRFYVQLDYLDGPSVIQALPIDCTADEAEAIERALNTAYLARATHDGINVRLLLPQPLGVAAKAEIHIAGASGGLPIRRDLGSDCTSIDLGPSDELPAGFREIDLHLGVPGFSARRVFVTEISHARHQGPAPSSLDERIMEALSHVAGYTESGTVSLLARLALGDAADAAALLEPALRQIEECWDCADFALVPLLWARMRWPEVLGRENRARIDSAVLGYRYWLDEPGNDVQWYFSENHALLFHTAAHLAGALLPASDFRRSGRAGTDQSEVGRQRLVAWFDHFERWEMAEFNSAPYFPIDLKGLTALFALSPDASLRERAGRAIARLVEIVANSAHQGVLTAAQGRSYEHSLRSTDSQELSSMARMLWGKGSHGSRFHALPQLALCIRDHGLVLPDLADRACLAAQDAQEWRFAQGRNGFARLYHYKTSDYALGSAVGYRWNEWGYQETLVHARLGASPQAQFWINHPGEIIHGGNGRPSYWGGSASIPRVQQYRDLAIVLFSGAAPQPDFTHCWFPIPDFDAADVRGDTALARARDAHLLLRGSGPFELVSLGPTAHHELRLAGRTGWWLVRLGSHSQHGDASQFERRFAGISLGEADGRLTIEDPEYGLVIFDPDGSVEAESRRLLADDYTVLGTRDALPRGPINSARQFRSA